MKMTSRSKFCNDCKETKSLEDFYSSRRSKDGKASICKECDKERQRKRYREKRDLIRQQQKEYSQTEKGKIAKYRSANKSMQNHQKENKARQILRDAVRWGKIEKAEACWHCGSQYHIEGHHVDYDNPLDVVWLCKQCHTDVHRGR